MIAFRRTAIRFFLALTLVLSSVAGGSPAYAQEMATFFESPRALAMGGTVTAQARGFDALFNNPAGLALTKYWNLKAGSSLERSVGGNVGSGPFFASLKNQAGQSATSIDAFLNTNATTPYTVGSSQFVGYHTARGFGIAHFETTRLHSEWDSTAATPTINLSFDRLTGQVLSWAFPAKPQMWVWGFSLKSLARAGEKRSLTSAEIGAATFNPEAATPGTQHALTADVGLMARLPVAYLRPTLGIAYLNAVKPDFGLPTLDPILPQVNVGVSIMPDIFKREAQLTLAAEFRDATHSAYPSDLDDVKREHFGMELSILEQKTGRYLLEIRGGRSQGLYSFGLGVNMSRNFSLDITKYEEMLGDRVTSWLTEKRWVLQLNVGI